MLRKIIQIDEEKCTGCRLCVDACHEGAIGMVDGKARLLRDDYCDGLGDCLPACPTDAITFVEREAAPYDEAAVAAHLASRPTSADTPTAHVSCPGAAARELRPQATAPTSGSCPGSHARELATDIENSAGAPVATTAPSRLAQWPAQIKLVPTQAPYYQGRGLLIAADCTAFACANFHERFRNGNITIIGCPKLDEGTYTEKLAAIIAANDIASVTVARMEVPCCGGLERAAAEAHARSGKNIPFEVVTFSIGGDVIG